jgi:hypothetical protein
MDKMHDKLYSEIESLNKKDFKFTKYSIGFFKSSTFSIYEYLTNNKNYPNLFLIISNLLLHLIASLFYFNFKKNKKTVLFFPNTGNQYNNFKPILDDYSGKDFSVILRNTNIENKICVLLFKKELNIFKYKGDFQKKNFFNILYSYGNFTTAFKSLFLFISTYFKLFTLKKNISKIISDKLKYYDYTGKRINQTINYIIRDFSYHISFIPFTEKCLTYNDPKLVIVSNEFTYYGKIIVEITKKMNIISMNIPHSMVTSVPCYWRYNSEIVILQGDHDKDYLIKKGHIKKSKLIITGRPLIERELLKRYSDRKVKKDLKITHGKKIVCLGTQTFDEKIKKEFILDVFSALKKNREDLFFIIKIHPAENEHYYYKLLSKEKFKNFNYLIIKNYNLYKILTISDLLITITSNIGAEALFKGVPVISYNKWGKPSQVYTTDGYVSEINSITPLRKKVDELLYNPVIRKNFIRKSKKYTQYMNYKLDGKSSERIISLIKSLIKN